MNVAALIPARSGSKSIPHKNIKELGNKPLMAWTIEVALGAGIRQVIVSTDSEEYAGIAKKYGAEVLMRPNSFAKDDTPILDVLRHEVPRIEPKPDIVILLQPTSPFRRVMHIKIALAYFLENLENYDSLISVEKVPEKYNPYAMVLEMGEKRMLFRKLIGWREKIKAIFTSKEYVGPLLSGFPIHQRMTRRQDLPQAWLPTGELYIFKTSNLNAGSIYGDKTMLYECEGSININEPDDWRAAEEHVCTLSEQ